ncbi:MAG: AbrB family transcriptional regulator [Thermosynechococcaceae cyanobacterium]
MAKKKAIAEQSEQQALEGKALLKKLNEIPHLPKREKAKECGYMINGRVNQSGFMNAILAAKGITLDSEESSDKRGREASYRTSVQKTGNILIGSAYTKKMGLQTGDEFEIKVGRKQIQLKLVPANS